jgi:thiol:disulfide interchange protein DsbD
MLARILPAGVPMALWALLFIVSAVYMGALEPLKERGGWPALFKGLGVAVMAYGLMLLFGAFSGAANPLDPLKVLRHPSLGLESGRDGLPFKRVGDLQTLLEKIESADKPVMVDFRADWCVSCKELEENTFSDPSVIKALKGYFLYQVDVTANSREDREMMRHFGIYGPPAILFFENGKEEKAKRISGYKTPGEFLKILGG